LVATPMYAAMSAGWFWATHGCNNLVDNDEALCKRINGGLFGLNERKELTAKTLAVLSA
jgi:putative chitinase